jgi:hypothetical protein
VHAVGEERQRTEDDPTDQLDPEKGRVGSKCNQQSPAAMVGSDE